MIERSSAMSRQSTGTLSRAMSVPKPVFYAEAHAVGLQLSASGKETKCITIQVSNRKLSSPGAVRRRFSDLYTSGFELLLPSA